jgi:adenylate cyclase
MSTIRPAPDSFTMRIPGKYIENLYKIGLICTLWVVCLFFYHLIIYFAIDEIAPGSIAFVQHIISGFVLGLLFGLINGFLEVFVFKQRFRRIKFGYTVIAKTVLFASTFVAAVVLFILLKTYLLAPMGLAEMARENEMVEFFSSTVVYKHGLYAILFSFGINSFLQVDSKMGRHVLLNLFVGRFYTPRRQKRVIMFLDLSSSTTIAEKIGDQQYSAFLRDFYYDLDAAISMTRGAVYQYAGDGAVVVWDVKSGVEDANCIRCFFEASNDIHEKENRYNEAYGVSPRFRAGIHLGEVIVTEVGGSKSEIAYHGDAMNTASRLCAAAKEYESGLLISAELLEWLPSIEEIYRIESIGLVQFRGKKHDIAAFTLTAKK